MKPCKHEDDESCSYVKLRKEDPKEIAKRLSDYVDEIFVNADEFYLYRAEDYWTDWEGLAWDSHFSFRSRIASIALEMRIEPEIKMMPVLIQKYFNWLKKSKYDASMLARLRIINVEITVRYCLEDSDLFLHQKTIKQMAKNIHSIFKSSVTPAAANEKEIDRKLKKFIRTNPRRYKLQDPFAALFDE